MKCRSVASTLRTPGLRYTRDIMDAFLVSKLDNQGEILIFTRKPWQVVTLASWLLSMLGKLTFISKPCIYQNKIPLWGNFTVVRLVGWSGRLRDCVSWPITAGMIHSTTDIKKEYLDIPGGISGYSFFLIGIFLFKAKEGKKIKEEKKK